VTGHERRGRSGATIRVAAGAGAVAVVLIIGLVAAATADSGGPHRSASRTFVPSSARGPDGGRTSSATLHHTTGLTTGTAARDAVDPPVTSTTTSVAAVAPTGTLPATSAPLPLPPAAPAVFPAASAAPGRAVANAPTSTGGNGVASALLAALDKQLRRPRGFPVTSVNIALLDHWFAAEGGLWANNPLNTSLGSAAYPHQFTAGGQDTGIPIYPNLGTGITMTASTLAGNPSYQPILRSLQSGHASCIAFANAVIRSPWASSHYYYDPVGFCTGLIAPPVRGHAHHRRGRARKVPRL
jgi:hypothetical protein